MLENFEAVLFDMDGVLIDSEPLWQDAEIEVFARHGVTLSREDCASTMGLRVDEVVRHWYSLRPWSEASCELVESEIVDSVINLVKTRGEAKLGVLHSLDYIASQGLPCGLASSSYLRIIEEVLDKLSIAKHFRVIHSAEFEKRGKPAPDVYLTAAQKIAAAPERCLVFEDSLNGVRAAKSAGMICVAIPDPYSPRAEIEALADLTINELSECSESLFERLAALPR
jgi:sugar-phosphatase